MWYHTRLPTISIAQAAIDYSAEKKKEILYEIKMFYRRTPSELLNAD